MLRTLLHWYGDHAGTGLAVSLVAALVGERAVWLVRRRRVNVVGEVSSVLSGGAFPVAKAAMAKLIMLSLAVTVYEGFRLFDLDLDLDLGKPETEPVRCGLVGGYGLSTVDEVLAGGYPDRWAAVRPLSGTRARVRHLLAPPAWARHSGPDASYRRDAVHPDARSATAGERPGRGPVRRSARRNDRRVRSAGPA